MSACQCSERKRPVSSDLPAGSNERPRQWFVLRRNESRSAFNGYRSAWSDYSYIACRACGAHWTTKSKVVGHLENSEYWPGSVEPKVAKYEELV